MSFVETLLMFEAPLLSCSMVLRNGISRARYIHDHASTFNTLTHQEYTRMHARAHTHKNLSAGAFQLGPKRRDTRRAPALFAQLPTSDGKAGRNTLRRKETG